MVSFLNGSMEKCVFYFVGLKPVPGVRAIVEMDILAVMALVGVTSAAIPGRPGYIGGMRPDFARPKPREGIRVVGNNMKNGSTENLFASSI